MTIVSVANPSTTTTTSSISITTYYEDIDSIVDTLNTGLFIEATSVPLKSVSITPSSYLVRNITNYVLDVQVENPLPVGSTMKVKIPSSGHQERDISLSSFSIGGVDVSGCTIALISPLYYEFGSNCFTSEVPASAIIKSTLSNMSNPTSTKPIESWEVEQLWLGWNEHASILKQLLHIRFPVLQFLGLENNRIESIEGLNRIGC